MAGPLGDPPTGAAIVFRGVGPDSIEGFVNDDPYVKADLVTRLAHPVLGRPLAPS